MTDEHALVLFSGGQDSSTCLAWALTQFAHVETVGFDYGQRHHVELQARQRVLAGLRAHFARWCTRLGPDHMLDLAVLGRISDSALTRTAQIRLDSAGLPNTFVPGRNLLFFQLAAALGYRRGLHTLVGGMCETDFSGYPDCRDATLKALEQAISLGMGQRFAIATPLMQLDKADTWALAHELGGAALVELIVRETHTCYHGVRGTLHAWGHGCGNCPACALRQSGHQRWQARASG